MKKYSKILEIASGNNFFLSKFLAQNGYEIITIDPILKYNKELDFFKIKQIQESFLCDEMAGNQKGYNIKNCDGLIGIYTCGATEHGIRQGLKYDKPFNFLLCDCFHNGIKGKEISNRNEYYDYLGSISNEVKIIQNRGFYYATNLKEIETNFVVTEEKYENL